MDNNKICLTCPPEQMIEISEDDMDDNRIAYIKEQIEFLKAELSQNIDLNYGSVHQPEAAAKIEESRNQLRGKILELLMQLADPQLVERREQEKQQYRNLLEKISADDASLKAAKDIAGQCEEDEYRQDIIIVAVQHHEATKLAIAKLLLEKLA